jgi:hypothetical protein
VLYRSRCDYLALLIDDQRPRATGSDINAQYVDILASYCSVQSMLNPTSAAGRGSSDVS